MTGLFRYLGTAVSARWKSLWQCRLPPLHRTQRWGTPRFGLGGKEPGAEILRWESPALPETPLPQDDYGDGIVVARLKSCPSRDQRVGGTLIHSDRAEHKVPPLRFASVGMTEFVSLCGDGRVFARWKLLWQCCLPPLHRTQRWGTPRFGLGGEKPLPEAPLPQDDVNFPTLLFCSSSDDCAEHKVPPLRLASVWMTEFVSLREGGRVCFRSLQAALAALPPTFAQNAKMGHPLS